MLRNNVFDNAKLIMVFLVVFGHLIEPIITQSEVVKTIYIIIYSVHMPTFIILAGAYSKLEFSRKVLKKHLEKLLIPFLVFTILYESFNIIGSGTISNYSLNWQPYWILWFLFSMFIWRVTLPIVMQFKFPLLLSVFVSLCAGYISDVGYFLGVSRTLYFFPFFILGYKLGASFLSNNYLRKIPKVIYFSALLISFGLLWAFNEVPYQWFYGSFSYSRIGDVEWFSFITRLNLYFISSISSIAILMLLPDWNSKMSKSGQNSLFVYVWHGFIVKVATYLGVVKALSDVSDILALITLFIFSVLITALLSRGVVAHLTNKYLLIPAQRLLLRVK